jgi:serine/threonine-protein kinase RsbW
MRNSMKDGSVELVISSDLDQGRQVRELIEKKLRKTRFSKKDIFGIRLALEEAIVNAIKHGNRMDRKKQVHVHFKVCADRFDIGITDEGTGYEPGEVPDPLADENLERPGGRGLLLMKHYMTEVTVHPPGNRLTMCKVLTKG